MYNVHFLYDVYKHIVWSGLFTRTRDRSCLFSSVAIGISTRRLILPRFLTFPRNLPKRIYLSCSIVVFGFYPDIVSAFNLVLKNFLLFSFPFLQIRHANQLGLFCFLILFLYHLSDSVVECWRTMVYIDKHRKS